MIYVRFPLSLRNVEDLLRECETNLAGQRWSGGAVEQWSNFHVTYATPPRCKTLFPNCTIIYIVKQRVIYVVFVSVYLLHLLHFSPPNWNEKRAAEACSTATLPSRSLWLAKGATGAVCGLMLAVRGCRNAISIHASISS